MNSVNKSHLKTFLAIGAQNFNQAVRLFEDGKIDLALEHAERSGIYQAAVVDHLTLLAAEDAADKNAAFLRLRPTEGISFECAVFEDNDWRVFATGPYTELVKAIVVAGYSTAKLESRFIVPCGGTSKITHYLHLEKLDETAA